jgi:hypothetical protein
MKIWFREHVDRSQGQGQGRGKGVVTHIPAIWISTPPSIPSADGMQLISSGCDLFASASGTWIRSAKDRDDENA